MKEKFERFRGGILHRWLIVVKGLLKYIVAPGIVIALAAGVLVVFLFLPYIVGVFIHGLPISQVTKGSWFGPPVPSYLGILTGIWWFLLFTFALAGFFSGLGSESDGDEEESAEENGVEAKDVYSGRSINGRCPVCEEFIWDLEEDSFEFGGRSAWKCPNCGAVLGVT